MKKIIVACCAAAAALSVFAQAQVYEMSITLKTTVSAKGKVASLLDCERLPDVTETGDLYRKQYTVKIKGLFWGCDCETIAEPQRITDPTGTFGYIFWNETTKEVIDSEFVWKLLHRIDSKVKKTEGAWTLGDDDNFYLTGAGFGTVKDTVDKKACVLTEVAVPSMSGNCAGWMKMPTIVVQKGSAGTCDKCEQVEGSEDLIATAPGWSLCMCGEGSELTAASGTWSLKYNSSLSKKWAKASASASIVTIYRFPDYVKKYIENL